MAIDCGSLLDVRFQRLPRALGPPFRDIDASRVHDRGLDVPFSMMNNAWATVFFLDVMRHAQSVNGDRSRAFQRYSENL